MDKRHILIVGTRGAGKSTLIEKLVCKSELPLSGYLTRSTPRDENGFHSIYIHRASDYKRFETDTNHIGDCNGHERTVYPEVFETLGVDYLKHDKGNLVVMDEIGFMEMGAEKFCSAVLKCLDGRDHVIAGVRGGCDIPFLNAVKKHPAVQAYIITPDNRDELYEILLPVILKWNEDKNQDL